MKYLAVVLALFAPVVRAERWSVQYFFDQDHDTLMIEDLAFPSALRGIAVGTVHDELDPGKKPRYISLVTSDGGEHWTEAPLKDHPRSLFFLNESTGWLVTDSALWFTEESGRTWSKIGEQKKPDRKLGLTPPGGLITRVWFVNAQHGFAVGLQKTILESLDGGKTWKPVEEAAKPDAKPGHAVYSQIWMDGKAGVIFGTSIPPRPDDPHLPTWMEPERAVKRKQVPTLTLLVQTLDGGETWHSSTAPLFGDVIAARLAGFDGLAVFSYSEGFEFPSDVYHLDMRTGATKRVFAEKDRRVTDCAAFAGSYGFLAGVEPPGKLNSLPVPGKVKILQSSDLNKWEEMDVDYKAVARSVVLAGPDRGHQWAGTDTGFILHLVP
ncbi:MAG TPA: YCF48-related protein [Bryobacteraceae bacterium]|nr:YCF48-related protein [Bryobacteraceae bacterium]